MTKYRTKKTLKKHNAKKRKYSKKHYKGGQIEEQKSNIISESEYNKALNELNEFKTMNMMPTSPKGTNEQVKQDIPTSSKVDVSEPMDQDTDVSESGRKEQKTEPPIYKTEPTNVLTGKDENILKQSPEKITGENANEALLSLINQSD